MPQINHARARELAKRVVNGEFDTNGFIADLLAHAYIEWTQPVEAQHAPTLLTGAWLCGACSESIQHTQKYCHMCGKEQLWK